MSTRLSHGLTRVLLATAAVFSLLAAVPASAAVIGSFDPKFNGGFSTDDPALQNAGFRGTITLEVSSACFAAGAASGFAVNNAGGCTATVDSAQILFYNFTLSTPGTVLTTVNLVFPAFDFGPNYVTTMFFDASDQFVGMNTQDSPEFDVSISDSSPTAPISYDGSMLLYFQETFFDPAFLVNCNASLSDVTFGADVTVGAVVTPSCSREGNQNSSPATVTFVNTAVPEPDSIALAALGLGALVVSRRRRTAR